MSLSKKQTSQNTAGFSSHLAFTGTSLPKALQTNVPTSAKIKPEYQIGYNLADIESLTVIGIQALDVRTQQTANENEELKKQNKEHLRHIKTPLEMDNYRKLLATQKCTINSEL